MDCSLQGCSSNFTQWKLKLISFAGYKSCKSISVSFLDNFNRKSAFGMIFIAINFKQQNFASKTCFFLTPWSRPPIAFYCSVDNHQPTSSRNLPFERLPAASQKLPPQSRSSRLRSSGDHGVRNVLKRKRLQDCILHLHEEKARLRAPPPTWHRIRDVHEESGNGVLMYAKSFRFNTSAKLA